MIQDIYPHKLKNSFIPGKTSTPESLVIHFDTNGRILTNEKGKPFYRLSDFGVAPKTLTYIFSVDEDDFFLIEDDEIKAPAGHLYMRMRDFRRREDTPKKSIFEAFTAGQLHKWYVNNKFCGRCGNLTGRSSEERAIVCAGCGNIIYPRVVPAVIVAVIKKADDRKDNEIVLTRYQGNKVPYFALVAGFTEIGETLEETVQREVYEETGLKVKNITYYKSQPWGVADDILAGFFCLVDGNTEITRDDSELSYADWTRREDVVLQPDDLSLTNEMMTLFKEGKEPSI